MQLDLRAAIPVAALAVVVLVIIFVELCGREELPAPGQGSPAVQGPQPTQPPAATAAPGPTATPAPPGVRDERDRTRQDDLATIQQALADYRDENGEYPDTGGNVQSLCVFEDTDAGCALLEVLDPIPRDPLGEPASENGYWYASDGRSYTVYAQRESEALPACPDHPPHLQDFESLLCVTGP